jgi:hypothetical protein
MPTPPELFSGQGTPYTSPSGTRSATPSVTEFLLDYPEFANIVNGVQTAADIVDWELKRSDRIVSRSTFGNQRYDALELLTAHRLGVRYKIGTVGVQAQNRPGLMTSQSASTGGLNFSMAHSALITGDQAWRADLSRTNYGLQYLSLIDQSVPPMLMGGI